MRKILAILFHFFFFFNILIAQENEDIYIKVDKYPDFAYSNDSAKYNDTSYVKLIDFFRENSQLKILRSYDETSAYKGLIIISFIVEINGTLSNIKVELKGFRTDEESLIVILNKTGLWTPGYIGDKKVRTKLSFPIYVNLE